MARRGPTLLRALTVASLVAVPIVLAPSPGPAAALAAPVSCGDGGTPAVVALQDQHFYVDSSGTAPLLSGYAGYSVRAGSAARKHLWIGYGDFTGGAITLAPQQASEAALPDLASDASAAEYVLLTATGPTTVAQTHTVTLYDGPPAGGGAPICSRSFTYADVVDTIKALANKVTSVTAAAPAAAAHIGDSVTVTVVGNTGTLGSGPADDPGVLAYTPNALTGFPASAWQLDRTELTISPDGVAPAVTYVDRLYLSGASGPARAYTARYMFHAVGPTDAAASLKPIQYIASGTQVKHTDQGGASLYSLPAVSAISDIALHKSLTGPASGVLPSDGGTATYRVTVSNAAGHATDLDWLADTMPSGAQFVPGSLAIDGHGAADPKGNGRLLALPGPLRVPASGTATLTYELRLDGTPGEQVNSMVGHYGNVVLDASPDVTDPDPATAAVTVLGGTGPALADDTASTPANTPVTVDVLANDSAPSGLPLHVSAVGMASSGTAVLAADGTITFTPAAGTSGRATFGYTATDGYAGGQATVTVTVAPAAARDLYSTGKNATLTGSSVLANDACTGCSVSTTLVTPPANGTVTMSANGTFTYVPASNQTGTVTFTYRATDPMTGLTADGTAVINVADLAPDYATTPNSTPVAIAVLANDPGCANGCKPQRGTDPARGTVTYSGGAATYTPTGTRWGLDSFSYGVTGSTGSSTIPVTVLVGPPSTAVTTTYGTAVVVPLPANGSCATCAYSVSAAAGHGAVSVDPATGTATYEPATGFAGADSFNYQVKDSSTGLRVIGTVAVTVGPKAVDDAASVLLGDTVTGDVATNDFCQGSCTFTELMPPAVGTLTWNTDGTWSYQPGSTIGTVPFSYRISSSLAPGVPSDATVRIAVGGARDDAASTPADTAKTIDVRANDPCTTCTLTAVTSPTSGTATIIGGTVLYTPAPGFSGQAGFDYTLSDGGATTSAHVTVIVLPHAQDDTATTVDGAPIQLLPLANDLCSGCALTGVDAPTSGTATRDGDVVTFTPAGLGTATFTYHAVDAWGDAVSGTVTVTVLASPSLVDDAQTTRSDTAVTTDVLGNDACSGCTVTISDDPRHGTAVVDVHDQIRYAAAPGFSGVDELSYVATDPTGAWAEARLTIVVTPVARDDSAATNVATPITVDVLANDDCTGCAIALTPGSAEAGAAVVGDQVEVTPAAGWSGTVVIGYTATDPATGDSDSAALQVDVSDARPDATTVAYGDSVTGLDVLANDTCTGCQVTAVTSPSAGTAGYEGTTVNWVPPAGFAGLATFGYAAGNGAGHTVASTVRILVAPAPRHVDAITGVPQAISVLSPADCAGCVVTLTVPPAAGDIDSDGAGGFTYTGAAGWTGDDAFGYQVTDPASGEFTVSSVTITTGQPPSPVAALTVAAADTPDPGTAPMAGARLTWTWLISNAGDVTLTDLASAATDAGSCQTSLPDTLAPGATITCTTTHVLTQQEVDRGVLAVSAPVAAQSTSGSASGTGRADLTLGRAPAIDVSAGAALGGSGTPQAGDEVSLTYTVSDTGNTTVTGVGAVLEDGTVLSCADATLLPGASTACTGTHAVTADDLQAGRYDSSGTATASSPLGAADLTAGATTSTPLPASVDPGTTASDPVSSPPDAGSSTAVPVTTAPVPVTTAPAPTGPASTSTRPASTSTRSTTPTQPHAAGGAGQSRQPAARAEAGLAATGSPMSWLLGCAFVLALAGVGAVRAGRRPRHR